MADETLLRWELDFGPEVVRLHLFGEMDASATEALEPALDALVATSQHVTIELGGVTLLEGSGLSVLMDFAQRLADRGVQVSFAEGSDKPSPAIDLTRDERRAASVESHELAIDLREERLR